MLMLGLLTKKKKFLGKNMHLTYELVFSINHQFFLRHQTSVSFNSSQSDAISDYSCSKFGKSASCHFSGDLLKRLP